MTRFTRSITLILLGCGISAFQVPDAQARPFQEYKNGNCSGEACVINFLLVPQGKRLTISNVSCYLRTADPAVLYAMKLLVVIARNGAIRTAVTLMPDSTDSLADAEVFSANETIYAFATAGQRFRATAEIREGGSFQQFACHISGQLTP